MKLRKPQKRHKPKEAEGMLNGDEMSVVFCCNRRELSDFAAQGMPRRKIGQSYYYKLEECQAWWRREDNK